MITRTVVFGGIAAAAVVVNASLQTIVTDVIVGVAVAIALFVLYYALVLRPIRDGQ
jgi:hypothetical protein